MSLEVYLAYLVACVLIAAIPGPTATLIIANSLTHGMRARALLSRSRVQLISRVSGACLIGGGVWLAATRAR